MCYAGQGMDAFFGQIVTTDTIKVCYDAYLYTANTLEVCVKCDDLIYNGFSWILFNTSNPVGIIEHKNKIAYDIEPKFSETICYDFLETEPLLDRGKILVVGNPPFGKNSSLAVKFFNHASIVTGPTEQP